MRLGLLPGGDGLAQFRVEPLVGVDGEQPFVGRLRRREILLLAKIGKGPHHYARAHLLRDLSRAVGAARIDHHDFVGQAAQRCQRFRQVGLFV